MWTQKKCVFVHNLCVDYVFFCVYLLVCVCVCKENVSLRECVRMCALCAVYVYKCD